MPMSWAMKLTGEVYCQSAMPAEITTNTTSSVRMHRSCLRSSMSLTRWPLMRSMVRVDELVSTSELSVDMLAESTSTITSG